MGKWLGRFSVSLLAIAFVLGWEGYRMRLDPGTEWRVRLYFAVAIVCLAAALVGAKERHRRSDDQQPPDPQ